MTTQNFKQYWQHHYPKCPPISTCLRGAYKTRWFRIHSLPESKRYAETDDEYREILRRYNVSLCDLLGDGGQYALVTTGYSESPAPTVSYPQIEVLAGRSEDVFSVPMHELEEDDIPNYWHFFVRYRTWKESSMDALLKLVADDVVADVLFVGVEQECIYHPYDGGADIIVASESIRDKKKQKYSAWLSKHDHGL